MPLTLLPAKSRTKTEICPLSEQPAHVVCPSPPLMTMDLGVPPVPSTQSTGTGAVLNEVAAVPSEPAPQQNGCSVVATPHVKPIPAPMLSVPNLIPPSTSVGEA